MGKFSYAITVALLIGAAGFARAAEHVVEIRDNKFQPEAISIKTGDTVRWVNQEKRTTHSVFFKEPIVFESERFFPGETWSHRFEKPGKVVYSCGPHPEMRGTIDVVD